MKIKIEKCVKNKKIKEKFGFSRQGTKNKNKSKACIE